MRREYEDLGDLRGELLGITRNGNFLSGDRNNTVVVGDPMTGKTSSFIVSDIRQCIMEGVSFLTVDYGGTCFRETSGLAKWNGYNVSVYNPAGKHGLPTSGMNVFEYVPDIMSLELISEAFIESTPVNLAPKELEDAVRILLRALMQATKNAGLPSGQTPSLCTAWDIFSTGGLNAFEAALRGMQENGDGKYAAAFLCLDKGLRATAYGAATRMLYPVCDSSVRASIMTPGVRAEDMAKQKTAVYIITPVSIRAYLFMYSLFINTMVGGVYKYQKASKGRCRPTVVFVDDASIFPSMHYICQGLRDPTEKLHFKVAAERIQEIENFLKYTDMPLTALFERYIITGTKDPATTRFISSRLYNGDRFDAKAYRPGALGNRAVVFEKDGSVEIIEACPYWEY